MRRPLVCAALAALVGAGGCTSLRAPVAPPVFAPAEVVSAEVEGFALKARPVAERDLSLELFDEDLPALGIAAVWVEIGNRRDSPADLRRARWAVEIAGRRSDALSTDAVLKRFYRARKIRMYTTKTDADARRAIESLRLRVEVLPAGGSASGFLYCAADPALGSGWARRAALAVRGVRPRYECSVSHSTTRPSSAPSLT